MATGKGSSTPREFKRFAWQGIRLTIPADWELVSAKGGYDSGYLALADADVMRLHMKWDIAGGKTDPSDSVSRYLRTIEKNARKTGREFTANRDLNLASLGDKQIECYEWTADSRGTAMVSLCRACSRIIHILLLSEAQESLRGLSRTVFASLKDHPENDVLPWRFYDVEFCAPKSMRLKRQELKTGCIRMLFRSRRAELEFVRVSLAQILLARAPLCEWFRSFYAPELKRWRFRVNETDLRGHSGVTVAGKPWLPFNPGRLLGRARELRAACWHCPSSNRLFIMRHSAPVGQQEVFRQAVESVNCCQRG